MEEGSTQRLQRWTDPITITKVIDEEIYSEDAGHMYGTQVVPRGVQIGRLNGFWLD